MIWGGEKEPGTWYITNEDCSSMLNPPKYQPSTSLLLHTGLSALRTRTTVLLNRPLSQQHLHPFPLPDSKNQCCAYPTVALTSIVVIIRRVLPLLLVRVRPQEVKVTILQLKRKKKWPIIRWKGKEVQNHSCSLMSFDFGKQNKAQKIIKTAEAGGSCL